MITKKLGARNPKKFHYACILAYNLGWNYYYKYMAVYDYACTKFLANNSPTKICLIFDSPI